MEFVNWIMKDAMETWREGFVPFVMSPYGILIMFIILFWFLNSRRRRM